MEFGVVYPFGLFRTIPGLDNLLITHEVRIGGWTVYDVRVICKLFYKRLIYLVVFTKFILRSDNRIRYIFSS